MMIREKWLGLVLIPFINTINYYLTYSKNKSVRLLQCDDTII